MKIKMAISLKDYNEKFCETEGKRLWAANLSRMSTDGTLEVLGIEHNGCWKTNAKFLGYHIGIPVEEQKYFIRVVDDQLINLASTFEASTTVPSRTMGFVMGKLMEEVGEFAKSLNQPDRCDERPVGEAADVINCVVDMLYLQYSTDYPELDNAQIVDLITKELNTQLDMKAEKWVEKACR